MFVFDNKRPFVFLSILLSGGSLLLAQLIYLKNLKKKYQKLSPVTAFDLGLLNAAKRNG